MAKAVVEDGGQTTGIPISVVLDNIIPGKNPCRVYGSSEEEDDKLAKDIKQHGLLQPLVVAPRKDGKFDLVAGYRRFAALQQIAAKTAAVHLLDETKVTAADANLLENIQRADLSPMEVALSLEALRKRKGWQDEPGTGRGVPKNTKLVAAFIGKSTAYVTQHEKLLALSAKERRQVHEGYISRPAAFELAKVSQETRDEIVPVAEQVGKEREEKPAGKGGKAGRQGKAKVQVGDVRKAAKKVAKGARVNSIGTKKGKDKASKVSKEAAKLASKEQTMADFVELLHAQFIGSGDEFLEGFAGLFEEWRMNKIEDDELVEGLMLLVGGDK